MGGLLFFDVGGHLGQTLEEVLKPEYAFDRVHCFEPLAESADRIAERFPGRIKSGHLVLHRVALSDRNGEATIFGDNSEGGATLFGDKRALSGAGTRTLVQLRRATDAVTELVGDGDRAVMKLNCEGAEGAILTDLAESRAIHRLARIMVDFDLRKIPGMDGEEARVMAAVGEAGYDGLMLADDVMRGPDHQARIRNWLAMVHRDLPVASDPALFEGLGRRVPLHWRLHRRWRHWRKRRRAE